jgi:hypothetical protein
MKNDEERLTQLASEWHHPISGGRLPLCRVLGSMKEFKLSQEAVPLIIKLTENPKYRTARLLGGAVDLFSHDCIHALLGRGLLSKDEAFVIGYTMGSSKRMKRWRRNLFMFICKYLYPEGYKLGEEERFVFYAGVMAGEKCATDLTRVDFGGLLDYKVQAIREKLGVDKELLMCYFCFEKKCFPKSSESQRLV